jgi:uncharacterized protein (DUF1501 family)
MDRRRFLTTTALTGTGLLLGGLGREAEAALTGYRSLVCLFLLGGNDSFNLLVPRSQAEYDVYANSRQNLAIPRAELLPINALGVSGSSYGLHPSTSGLQALFESGRAAFIANCGPLIQPTTAAQAIEGAVPLPPQLFSHNDQQDQWQTLKGRNLGTTGWAGRAADLLQGELADQLMPLNASLLGNLPWQAAEQALAYAMGPTGAVEYTYLNAGIPGAARRRLAFERVLAAGSPSIYGRALAEANERALLYADRVLGAIASAPPIGTAFPADDLGTQLGIVAKLIAARETLNMRRQIFIVATGGFDTHDDQNELQPGLLGKVSTNLAAFHAATVELGVASAVTTFTMSDFGRTLTSNGDGTDHGWGGHQVVLGDAVRGRDIYGPLPRLEIDGPDDVGGGRIVPTTSVDQLAATLLRWFGLTESQIDLVAPALDNFPTRDLGFFNV